MLTRSFFAAAVCGLCLQIGLTAAPAKNQTLATANNKARQSRPIPLGVSGGSVVDKVKNGCCSGTLGSLVQDKNGTLYILSNTHVLAGDSASGGNGKVSAKGDPINQPGYIDVNCKANESDYVAKLEKWQVIAPNGVTPVDAAIAKVEPGMVDASGRINQIGTISSTPIDAFVGQKVKKSGRTSGLTKGQVTGLHATISVEYTDECGGKPYTSTYHDQILIGPGSFIKGGDSGSLMVEDVDTNPRPVGLLFAGSDSVAIANPIQLVLDTFGVSMVGTPVKAAVAAAAGMKITTAHKNSIAKVKGIKTKYHETLMKLDGAKGHAVGFAKDGSGKHVVLMLVERATDAYKAAVPKHLEGVPVETLEVGKVKAF